MIKYQLHLNGKNRAHHTFNTKEEAESHKCRLIKFCQDKMNGDQLNYMSYYKESKLLEVVGIEIDRPESWFSLIEYSNIGSHIIKTYPKLEMAEQVMNRLTPCAGHGFKILELRLRNG